MNRKEARLEDYLFLIGKLTDDRFGASSVFEVQPTIGITILAAPTDIISSSLYICFTSDAIHGQMCPFQYNIHNMNVWVRWKTEGEV
jgi:hypothetical protein